jgi:3-hydroxyacyl-CoA dehydrogenase
LKNDIRKLVVLGSGVMGSQIAAHAAACGLDVVLLDMPAKEGGDRSALARRALEGLRKMKPAPLHLSEHARLVRPGNFEDDWAQLKDADWVLEVVVEDLEIKRGLLARVAETASPRVIVSSNTSGLGIGAMSAVLPEALRKRFLGTHFFNPPRYLKLLEVIPGPDTDPAVVQAMTHLGDAVLGKGVVLCKDTPLFIGNRVGMFAFAAAMHTMVQMDLTIEEVDVLTGPVLGRPRSATFRTADIAGVDICHRVASHLYQAVPSDPERDVFKLPPFVMAMVEKKWLGDKTGGGFYRKEGSEIRTLDWKTLEYRERRKARFPSVDAAMNVPELGARLQQVLAGKDKAAEFLWHVLSATCLYAAAMVPEISDDVVSIDHALEWGYAWKDGPFRVLDALGPRAVADRLKSEGRPVPALLESLIASGRTSFYMKGDYGRSTVFGPTGVVALPERRDVVDLAAVRERGGVRKKNAGASLLDLGEGCALVEFHSKMNVLGADAIEMILSSVKEARAHFDALVVGNQGENFSAGANLMLVLMAVQEEEWDDLDLMIRRFQQATMALKYSDVPVVVAPFGLTLGGGAEVTLHAARVRASAETYMGLVEVGVGVIPAGGGTKELLVRALDRSAGVEGADPFPFVKRVFDLIAFARVSTSGLEAQQLFLTPADGISMGAERLLEDAKQTALGLARAGYRAPRPRLEVPALGRPALATFKMGIHNFLRAGQISEHDALIATKLATILCGGDRAAGSISEQGLLDLEREAFLSLLGTRKTQERIQHMLKEGKPLRN